MKESILNDKTVLAVSKDPDVLAVLEEEIVDDCPACQFHKALSYQEAVERIHSFDYDAVLLDMVGVRGLNLAEMASRRNFPIAVLTAHPLTPEVLENRLGVKIQAYLPKEHIGEIVPFLEELFIRRSVRGWKRFFLKIGKKFEVDWEKRSSSTRKWVLSGAKV